MSLSDLSLQGDGDDDNTVFGLIFSTKLPYAQPQVFDFSITSSLSAREKYVAVDLNSPYI